LVEPALERLLRARDRDRLPQSMLLIGPPGLGRELAAVEAAVLLVCSEAESLWADGSCADRLRGGFHPDVQAVRPSGAKQIIKIEHIREVVSSAAGRPYEGERRVWIFDGVEANRLEAPSANAFLKTLEEPPPHAVFILLADNPSAVLPTIRSRCQQLALPGSVAVARQLTEGDTLPELAGTSLVTDSLEEVVERIRSTLETGDLRDLVCLPYALTEDVPPFATVAAVAMQLASQNEAEVEGEEFARLAADLLKVEAQARALNLNRRAQMASCLMRWQRELHE
jgi:DNA polymerase III delta prime subunit